MISKRIPYAVFLFLFILGDVLALDPSKLDPSVVSILVHPNFLMFRRGENRKILEQDSIAAKATRLDFGSSKFDAIDHFRTQSILRKQTTRNLMRSYLRFLHTNQYIVNPPSKYPDVESTRRIFPVLHFEDGEKNHYLLKRVTDEIFDLILLQYSSLFHQYSGKKIENYPLLEFIQTAQVSGSHLFRIAIYEDGSFQIPRLTNLEIPIQPISIVHMMEAKKIEEEKSRQKTKVQQALDKMLTPTERANEMIGPFMRELIKSRTEEDRKLKKKKDLVIMRLPYLKAEINACESLEEITALVKSEIIRQIFDPYPSQEHCPGSLDSQNRCYPDGKWDAKTWVLYRRLYRIEDVAEHLYPAPSIKNTMRTRQF